LAFDKTIDVYTTLQVSPSAHEVVIRAAYHALARRYHPDGDSPDARRMAELNYAYDLVRDDVRRRIYDERRREIQASAESQRQPVGPGTAGAEATQTKPAAVAPPGLSPYAGPFGRARPEQDSMRIDFGRYTGWSLRELARHDPDYLRWLSRHSSGVRYRPEILRLLPEEAGAAAAARRDPVR
jgi:curved DNA-binding protein CbpA